MDTSDSLKLSSHKDEMPYSLSRKRQAALAELDNAPFSRFHLKIMMVAGVGFFTDAYDLFAINIASTMIGNVYGPLERPGTVVPNSTSPPGALLTSNQELGLKVASPVGTLIGQLLFGWLADIVGRKRMYGVELILVIFATFSQTLAGRADAISIIATLILWRGIAGIGIGGDYPLSAIIASEYASINTRGRLMSGVFAAQGWGQLAAAIVGLCTVVASKNHIKHCDPADPKVLDTTWRIIIGVGAIPACVALYFRLTVSETPRFTMDIERNIRQATQDVDTFLTTGTFIVDPDAIVQRAKAPVASRRDFIAYFSQWSNLKVLIGTSYSWFALDIAFFGSGLNNTTILQAIHFGDTSGQTGGPAIYQNLLNSCIGNMIISAAGLIPGYYATMLLIDTWGRKPIQLMGFVILTILFAILGFAYDALTLHGTSARRAFVFLYCLANFFFNFGPNATTFIIPGEAFPTRYRSTAHGISAATGKLGAIISQVGFSSLKDHGGAPGSNAFVKHLLEIFAFFTLTGVFSTLLIPETKGRSLEDLSNENQDNFISGVVREVDITEETKTI